MQQKDLENQVLYWEMREGAQYPEAVMVGLQAQILKHLTGVRVDAQKIKEAKLYIDAAMGPGIFNERLAIH
jgi:hypothetical protein